MDNFNIFDRTHLHTAIDPFAPGMSDHITPIKYEALTPDVFAFLFRTTGRDGAPHFFVLLQYDYMTDLDAIKHTINTWHGHIIEFWPAPNRPAKTERESVEYDYGNSYKAVLTRVARPTGEGYWASYVTITPRQLSDSGFMEVPAKQRTGVKASVERLVKERPEAIDNPISLYINNTKGIEIFYN